MAIQAPPQRAHPVKGVLAVRRITLKNAAEIVGVHPVLLGRMINRLDKPTPRIRRALAALLQVPEAELFDEVRR